jgi:peroxisomal membrane protein 4
MTYTHARNLGFFVFLYKCFMSLQRWYYQQEAPWHAFVAGFLGGYLAFGDESSPVNKQVR